MTGFSTPTFDGSKSAAQATIGGSSGLAAIGLQIPVVPRTLSRRRRATISLRDSPYMELESVRTSAVGNQLAAGNGVVGRRPAHQLVLNEQC